MYPAMLQLVAFAALVLALRRRAPPEQAIFGDLGASAGLFAAAALVLDYHVQLWVVPASLGAGEHDGIALLTQFNPHGLFIAVEEAGYLAMSAALACLAPVVPGKARLDRAIRWTFLAAFAVTVAGFAVIAAAYGVERVPVRGAGDRRPGARAARGGPPPRDPVPPRPRVTRARG